LLTQNMMIFAYVLIRRFSKSVNFPTLEPLPLSQLLHIDRLKSSFQSIR
jgi:hypothetical protein